MSYKILTFINDNPLSFFNHPLNFNLQYTVISTDNIDSIIVTTVIKNVKSWVWSQIRGNSVDLLQKNNLSVYFINDTPGDLKVFKLIVTFIDDSIETYYIPVKHITIVKVDHYVNFYTQHFPLYFKDELISEYSNISGKINDSLKYDVGKLQLTNFNYTGGLLRTTIVTLPTINDKLKIQTFNYLNTSFIKVVLQTYTHTPVDKLTISNFTYLSGIIRRLLIQYNHPSVDKLTISNFTYTSGSIT